MQLLTAMWIIAIVRFISGFVWTDFQGAGAKNGKEQKQKLHNLLHATGYDVIQPLSQKGEL